MFPNDKITSYKRVHGTPSIVHILSASYVLLTFVYPYKEQCASFGTLTNAHTHNLCTYILI